MSTFELVTAMLLGALAGMALAMARHWRALGSVRLLGGGALGGLVGGLLGYAAGAAEGPAWGELHFHPAVIAAALGAGAAALALLHLFGDGRAGDER